MLLEPGGQGFIDEAFHDRPDFRRNKLILGLGRELGIGNLYGKNGGQTFTAVVTRDRNLLLLGNAGALTIGGHLTRQCTAEAGQMGAAVALRDVVGKGQYRLVVGIVPPLGYFYRNAVFLARNLNRLGDQRFLGAIDIFDEFDDTALV